MSENLPNIQNLSLSTDTTSDLIVESNANGKVYEGTRGAKCLLEVNYATIVLKKLPKEVFHYDVTFEPESPKKMLYPALIAFMTKFFPSYSNAFDGRKNMITPQRLEVNKQRITQSGFTEEVDAVLGDRTKKFKVTVKYAATIDWSVLQNYKDPKYQKEEKPSIAIQALDIVLKNAFLENIRKNEAIQAGRSLYFVPKTTIDLGDGMELWYGL